MCDWGVHYIYTVCPDNWHLLYPSSIANAEIKLGYTGYISDKWINGTNSVFKDNYNCLVVNDAKQLYDVLSKNNKSTSKIVKNAKKLLKPHLEVNWTKLFN